MNLRRFAMGLVMTAISVAVIFAVVKRIPNPALQNAFRV